MKYTVVHTTEGCVGFAATDEGVCHLRMTAGTHEATRAALAERYPEAEHDPDLLPEFQEQLRRYFAGDPVTFDVKIDLQGMTPFQRKVLDACATIGYGHTLTYSQLARLAGNPRAARAVGNAMARNPLPLVIPCHRVVAGNGKLGGFSAEQGVGLKKKLLTMEAQATSR